MLITLDRSILEKLLGEAAFASHLIGHLDVDSHRGLIGEIGEHVDTIVHELTELLGDPGTLAVSTAAASSPRDPRDAVPALTTCVGGAL